MDETKRAIAGDAVVATVQGREVTGYALYFDSGNRAVIRLDEPQVFDERQPGWHQTVPNGTPIRTLYWPRHLVRVDPTRPRKSKYVMT